MSRKWTGLWRGSVREGGRIVMAKGWLKREIWDSVVGEDMNVFNGQTLHLIIVLVWLVSTVLVPFSMIYIVSQSFAVWVSPEPGSCMRAQRVQTRSFVNIERPSTSAAYVATRLTISQIQYFNTLYEYQPFISHKGPCPWLIGTCARCKPLKNVTCGCGRFVFK